MRRQSRAAAAAPARGARAPRTGGEPLSDPVRREMAPRFRHDFGDVRVHTDDAAAAAARSLGARAYTIGTDVTFAAGEYAPGTAAGRELIAHELAHVVQQAHGGATPDAEARADGAAAGAMRGGSVDAAALGGAPISVQTKPDEPAPAPAEKAPDVITGADVPVRTAASPTATVLDGFVRDKARLTKRHRDAIEQIAFAIWLELSLHADAKATIAISGHTDTTAGDKHNSGLSTERAENAKAALEAALRKQEIDPAKLGPITATGHGETKLRVATGDEVDEPGNRRVEIEVTIEVKAPAPSPDAPTPTKPLPGMPGGPKIWEVPGLMDELDPGGPPTIPRAPKSKGEWLEEALKRDPLLKQLPKWAREKAIGALKDADEKAAEAIIDAVPFDDEYKQAAKAAMKALLQTLKGRKFKPPPEPPRGIPEDMLKTPGFPKAPGEMIFKLPPIRF